MHVIAHVGVRTHVRESALKVDSGRKIPCRTGISNLRRQRAGPMLYQLSYIPTPLEPNCRHSYPLLLQRHSLTVFASDIRVLRKNISCSVLFLLQRHSLTVFASDIRVLRNNISCSVQFSSVL